MVGVSVCLLEAIKGLYMTDVIYTRGLWPSLDDVEYATLERVDRSEIASYRLIGNMPQVELKMIYSRQEQASAIAA